MRIDLTCPIENRGTIVKTNEETGIPYLLLKLFNISDKVITSVTFRVLCYGANGEELESISVSLDELNAEPGQLFAETKAISLENAANAKHFVVAVDNAVFENGETYEPSEAFTIDADESEASFDDILQLRNFVPEAICFAADHGNYYRCVCGRANLPDAESCVRCNRKKDEMIDKFSSRDALSNTIEKAEEEAKEQALLEEARLAEEKAVKNAKTKKIITIALIAIIAASIVGVAGLFIGRAILNANADKAAESGDYLKAYELYQKTGSEKITEMTNYVQGNTPANLMFQGGITAEDEEHTYYLVLDNATFQFQLIKENKSTKEKTTLTDSAGGSINVSKDWIYFMDSENQYIKRISKDGQNIETVLETPVAHLSLIGNTIYYIKTDYDNPNNLSEEQCQTLVSQGQMKTFRHLYSMNVDTKKATLISEENIGTCYIYGDRIYYLTENEDQWLAYNLMSINLDGKDKKAIVDAPVATFYIQDDELYYVPMYKSEFKGQEIASEQQLDYALMRKNLKTGETTVVGQEYMTTYVNGSGDNLFFIALKRDEYMQSFNTKDNTEESATQAAIFPALYAMNIKTGKVTQLIAGEIAIFNVTNNQIIAYIQSQGMCRVNADGTGFEQLLTETPAAESAENGETTEELPLEIIPAE